ncbi:hypothetical protein P10VF_251 [Rhizobium phage vB_RleM_P10VF]|uniref:Uncharacterized protein n=1 Tax=Rhizobium phage vB_RleM_P10VF TaxID=1527770 RepID=A0A076YNS1_9CAUD|nr:hypothetical protein P10VF_251 [Rhizobium phage vB_RleM_P10VF]AIK68464.1 hypothetical protein P10VF_251 [Rhizobium phage vB_RleM_P10VF]
MYKILMYVKLGPPFEYYFNSIGQLFDSIAATWPERHQADRPTIIGKGSHSLNYWIRDFVDGEIKIIGEVIWLAAELGTRETVLKKET